MFCGSTQGNWVSAAEYALKRKKRYIVFMLLTAMVVLSGIIQKAHRYSFRYPTVPTILASEVDCYLMNVARTYVKAMSIGRIQELRESHSVIAGSGVQLILQRISSWYLLSGLGLRTDEALVAELSQNMRRICKLMMNLKHKLLTSQLKFRS